MIGSHLEGADLESRVASWAASATVKRDLAAVRATSQGTITIRATGDTQPARLRKLFVLERTGTTGRSRSTCTCRSSQEGTAPASSESATRIRARFRIRLRSPSTTRLRLRRRLPARTGAVQVDVGVARAVRLPALGALALLAVTAPAHRCTEGNVKAGPAIWPTGPVPAAGQVGADPARIPEMSEVRTSARRAE
jgi:hypothetical protein